MRKQEIPSLTDLHKEIFKSIRDTASTTIDDPRAPRIIMEKFKTAGASTIKEWLKSPDVPKNATTYKEIEDKNPQIVKYAINIIMIIADACEKPTQDRTLFDCVVALGEMFKAATDLEPLKVWIAGKIIGVRDRFKNKEDTRDVTWYKKAKDYIEKDLGIPL